MHFDWPIMTLRADHVLIYSDTRVAVPYAPRFYTSRDAELWLIESDTRGTVQHDLTVD